MAVVGWAINIVASLYLLVLIARVIVDWVFFFSRSLVPRGFFLVAYNVVSALTDPPVNWLRQYIPPLRFNGVALDVGYAVLFFAVVLLSRAGSWLVSLS